MPRFACLLALLAGGVVAKYGSKETPCDEFDDAWPTDDCDDTNAVHHTQLYVEFFIDARESVNEGETLPCGTGLPSGVILPKDIGKVVAYTTGRPDTFFGTNITRVIIVLCER